MWVIISMDEGGGFPDGIWGPYDTPKRAREVILCQPFPENFSIMNVMPPEELEEDL